jgi:DNA primase
MYLDIQRMKAEITMEHILDHYGIRLRAVNSHRLTGCCPIPHGDNANAFHVDLKRNLFHCFTHCGGGSIFDFVMKMDQLEFYPAARKIWDIFYPSAQSGRNFLYWANTHISHFIPPTWSKEYLVARPGVPILRLQPNHPYLRKRNISTDLARSFHMGYCRYGMMKNRIAIPIIDMEQHIAAYAGRAIHHEQSPRYLFPKNFKKSQHLFNIQRIQRFLPIQSLQPNPSRQHFQSLDQLSNKPVFLVEGFFDCIHIVKAGFEALSLMGTTVSSYQLDMMKETRRFFLLMMDGDNAGRNATAVIEQKLTLFQIPFRTVNLMDGQQPDGLNYEDLKSIVENKKKVNF